jgi:phosphoesterase RecJ-like protein
MKMRERTGVAEDDIDDLSALPRRVEGVMAGISAYEQPDGSIKMSVRTTEEIDASSVCANLGGGGHPRAAGCGMKGPARVAIQRVVDEVSKQLLRY